jgi:2-phospho-L-lactate guanylyltransferase
MTGVADAGGIWAIVPVKRLDHAKSRLSLVLGPAERMNLARAMICDVLDTLDGVAGLSGVVVVTNDAEVSRFASAKDAVVLGGLAEAGFNHAVEFGLSWLETQGIGGAIVVPGDIPFASGTEFSDVVHALNDHDLVLAPAARDGGTNVLAMRLPKVMPPIFGDDSFRNHLAAARALGVEPHVLYLDGASHDIDVSSDLFWENGGGCGVRTRALLKHLARPNAAPVTGLSKEMHGHE